MKTAFSIFFSIFCCSCQSLVGIEVDFWGTFQGIPRKGPLDIEGAEGKEIELLY